MHTTVEEPRTKLTRTQIAGFLAAWFGWIMDGVDSFVFSLVLVPSLTELLPKSGFEVNPQTIGATGTVMFGVFLVGWGFAFIWGPIADRFGRTPTLMFTIIIYSVFTAANAFADNIWQMGIFRFLAGIGVGGEWAIAGVYVAELLPENRRKLAGGLLNSGYYLGFLIAAGLNYTVGVQYGWRAVFLCGLVPAFFALFLRFFCKEPPHWKPEVKPLTFLQRMKAIFDPEYRGRTMVMTTLLTVSVIGVWAGSVYAPTAVRLAAQAAGMSAPEAGQIASISAALLAVATIIGNLVLPLFAETIGRRWTLALYFIGMMAGIVLAFQYAFYLHDGLWVLIASLLLLGFSGGNFAIYNLWLPELYATKVRATAFAFTISFGRFIAAAVNFVLAAAITQYGSIGTPIAITAVAFLVGLAVLPFAIETKGRALPK
jgi:MFS family permease